MIDVCPTGLEALTADERADMALPQWYAMQQHHRARDSSAEFLEIFSIPLAEIEINGLLIQAATALGESIFSLPYYSLNIGGLAQ